MEGYVKIAKVGDLSATRGLSLRVDGEEVALFRVGGEVFAVRNDCPHQHFSLLHQGALKEYALTCPMHGWTFDLRTGTSIIGNGNLRRYNVKIVGDDVWLEQPKGEGDDRDRRLP
jgi:nitrite reductase/ring-hydroxylating ferredoxin subunit